MLSLGGSILVEDDSSDLADTMWYISVKIVWNAPSTFEASSADVSMNDSPFSVANALASSVGTARRCFKSLLLPTSMMTMFESAWSRNSFNHRVTLTYVACLAMSYTRRAPTAPR